MKVAAVVIGRNEGERLIRGLKALNAEKVSRIIYVDSGSIDGSIDAARALGAEIVALDMSMPFTAARARNAGLELLRGTQAEFAQVIDGDCEVQPGWIETAVAFLEAHPEIAIVAGRLRERRPDATIWNRLADMEWNRPSGQTEAVAGTAVLRLAAIEEVDGYCDTLIAGEEPEMCLRLRQKDWKVWRLDAEMALHDIDMTRFSQWWRRTERGGHAYAAVASMHLDEPGHYRIKKAIKALCWGFGVPLAAILGFFFVSPWALLIFLAWPLQVLRLSLLKGYPLYQAFFLVLSKLPEAQGVLLFLFDSLIGRRQALIEYKSPPNS